MKLNLLVYGVIAAVVLVPGYFIGRDLLSTEARVGECVKQVDHNAADLKFDEVSCKGRRSADEFELGAVASTCPPGDYTAVPRGGEKACYLPSVVVGACFVSKQYQNTNQPVFVRGDCKQAGARKVESVIQDKSDKSECANKDLSLAFSQPTRTVCMVKP